jgi:ribonuclease HI
MNTNDLPKVDIYSDWWANPNPWPWGYGVIMRSWEYQKDFSQWFVRTTNNRMELMWAITGFRKLKKKSQVTLHTDSQYTINGLEKWWAKKWKANNWYRTWKQKAINHDLWEILLDLSEQHEVTFQWIKWHNGHLENEMCDELATLAMQRDDLIVDEGFIEEVEKSASQKKTAKNRATLTETFEKTGTDCRNCDNPLVKKIPKHNKKTLEKAYFYAYYHHCPACKTNYMLEEAKRDIKDLVL